MLVASRESVASVLLHSELIRLQGEKMRPKSLVENSADDLLIGNPALMFDFDYPQTRPSPEVVIY